MEHLKQVKRIALVALAVFLTGCSLTRTPYERPDVNTPEQWHYEAQAPSMLQSNDRWWELFSDAQLNTLMSTAFERNNDLAAAALKVRQAQLQARIAQSDLWPSVSASASGRGSRGIEHSESWGKSAGTQLQVSYEVDLWGRVASLRDVALWEAQATQADKEATALSLAGTVADLYWQLAYVNQRITSTKESIAYAQKTFDLIQAQYDAGAVSSLEPTQARQNILTQEANLSELTQQRIEIRNALTIIFDLPPSENGIQALLRQEPLQINHDGLPEVSAGIPAELLARRPDLRSAELRLKGVLANADAVKTSYYPRLSLTGDLGTSSTSLGNLLNNPVAALGAGLVLPFVQFNEMRFETEIARLRYEEAVVNFRQVLYQAFSDVENTLSAREQLNIQYELLKQSLADSQKTEFLYEERYRVGKVALKEWLDAQEKRRQAEISLAANQLLRLQNQVKLYQALGGGTE